MVMAVLADGKNLARMIVPKALLTQTAQVVQTRLGGLVGREVRHIPFSRKTPTTPDILQLYARLHRKVHDSRGLILTSHEHLLSFKLGGRQHVTDGKSQGAESMTAFQGWLDRHCRDVLDECDFTLSVKTQLNYPSGPEMAVDGHPFRWQVAEELLELAAHHVSVLQKEHPGSIEVQWRTGSFPMVQFLKSQGEAVLHDRILHDVCAGRTALLRPEDASSFAKHRGTVRRVLSDKELDKGLLLRAVCAFANPKAAAKTLYVIRGLLQNHILTACLGKRWNVQYGLHPLRHPVAVPYEAKGMPSEQSEFGHPDVAILLTCLSFYYAGLTPAQFRQGLQHILESDDPSSSYERWTSGHARLPETLHHWDAINVDDSGQVDELWECLRQDRVVVDHYLNTFVFPFHARQFEVKLQLSAWDIPLLDKDEKRRARTTGFSGTNDIRLMLPKTIRQDDLPGLRHTSAEVLSYLLQRRHRGYRVVKDAEGKRLSEEGLLRDLHRQQIRILIDAGAYILGMDNKTVAQQWLSIDTTAKAAVYVRADNRVWVHFREETKNDVPLVATPFADNLADCLVYLDMAHTRGIDLKLPVRAHGALTIALKQTKDYTVQGKHTPRPPRSISRAHP